MNFEKRVRAAATRNRGRSRATWLPDDRGLLQLVPDDELVKLGLLDKHTLASIRTWAGPDEGTYAERRDSFNKRLAAVGANYCACPPAGWDYPYPDDTNAERRLRDLLSRHSNADLQRTPVTNGQFEAFDPSHSRYRRMDWSRGESDRLDDHPAIQVSWFQARMFCVWLTGSGGVWPVSDCLGNRPGKPAMNRIRRAAPVMARVRCRPVSCRCATRVASTATGTRFLPDARFELRRPDSRRFEKSGNWTFPNSRDCD